MNKKVTKNKVKVQTTYDRFIGNMTAKQKKEWEEEYKEFLVSEMLLAAMHEDEVSVRELAKLAGVSPEEIAMHRNASEALETVIFGLDLKAGDEVVLTKPGRRGDALRLDRSGSMDKAEGK